jgi:hypothetical protein
LTTYYSNHGRVFICLNLIGGDRSFPEGIGLSLGFEGNLSLDSFVSTFYPHEDYEILLKKQRIY